MMYDYLLDKFSLDKDEIDFIPIRTNNYKEAKELAVFLTHCGYTTRSSVDDFMEELSEDHKYSNDAWYITLKYNTRYLYYTVHIGEDIFGIPDNLTNHYVIDINDLNKDYTKIDI